MRREDEIPEAPDGTPPPPTEAPRVAANEPEPWQLRAMSDDIEERAEAIGGAVESGEVDPDALEAEDDPPA